jgi:hypothetical protein
MSVRGTYCRIPRPEYPAFVGPYEATLTRSLREAGALIIAKEYQDDKVRLRAAQWIAGEAVRRGKLEEEARKLRAEDVRKIVENLGAAAREAAGAGPPAKRGAELLEEIRQAPPMEAEASKPPAPQVRYVERLVSKPGHFPPQFVKVAVGKTEAPGA